MTEVYQLSLGPLGHLSNPRFCCLLGMFGKLGDMAVSCIYTRVAFMLFILYQIASTTHIFDKQQDVVPQQRWRWILIHISLVRYTGSARDGGLRKLREELEAENAGMHIPAEIRGGMAARCFLQPVQWVEVTTPPAPGEGGRGPRGSRVRGPSRPGGG